MRRSVLRLAVLGLAWAATPAPAATLEAPTPPRMVITAAPGEDNTLEARMVKRPSGGFMVVRDTAGTPLTIAGSSPTCAYEDEGAIACKLPTTLEFGPLEFIADLGDGDDALILEGGTNALRGHYYPRIDFGPGNDRMQTINYAGGTIFTLDLYGGPGNDEFVVSGYDGRMDMGPGDDYADTFSSHASEMDVFGGDGDDELTTRGGVRQFGQDGDDELGGDRAEVSDGGAGNDLLHCGALCSGGPGDDTLENGGSSYGGPGSDRIVQPLTLADGDGCPVGTVVECVPGEDGDDTIVLADFVRFETTPLAYLREQRARCGGGDDTVQRDPRDSAEGDCETVAYGTGTVLDAPAGR